VGCVWSDPVRAIPFGEILPEGCDSNQSAFYSDWPWPYLADGRTNLVYVWKVSKSEMKDIDL